MRKLRLNDKNEEVEGIPADEVVLVWKTMKNSNVSGPGRISIKLIKNDPGDVFEIFAQIFTKCLKGEEIMYIWKQVNITSLIKKGDWQKMWKLS